MVARVGGTLQTCGWWVMRSLQFKPISDRSEDGDFFIGDYEDGLIIEMDQDITRWAISHKLTPDDVKKLSDFLTQWLEANVRVL